MSRLVVALALAFLPTAVLAAYFHAGTYLSSADPTSLVLPSYNDAYANWTNAGLQSIGGIPTRSTQCGATVNPSGKVPPASGDDAALIQAAITACAAGDVVQLGAGTFNIAMSEVPIIVSKGVTLRGTGACTNASSPYCSTVIQEYDGPQPTYNLTAQCGVTIGSTTACPNLNPLFLIAPLGPFNFGWSGCAAAATSVNPQTSNCGTLLSANVSQGQKTIQVASTTGFSVGGWMLMDQASALVSTVNPTGGANIQATANFLTAATAPPSPVFSNPDGICTYSFCTDRLNQELHKITAIGAGPCPGANCTLTFDSQITANYSTSQDARAYYPTLQTVTTANPFISQAGIENLTITRVAGGGVNFEWCAYCWAKGIEVGYWIAGAVNMDYAPRTEITGSYFHDCIDCQNNGSEYPIGISTASTEDLIHNNIILKGGKCMVGRGANTAVVAYNYGDMTFYEINSIGDYWQDMCGNGSHYADTHHFLFEGNWFDNCDNDETHGSSSYHTYFRNDCTGVRTAFTDPSNSKTVDDANGIGWATGNVANPPAPLRAAGPMALNYWDAYVGNVLGTSGVTTTANGWVYSGTAGGADWTNKAIWLSGWTGAEWPGSDHNLNGVTHTWVFRHGDYDYVNGSIADWTTGYSHTLPNSFFLTSAPSYFTGTNCTYPWPWVTPTAASPLQTPTGVGCTATDGLPAKARWDAGTPFVQP